MVTAMKTICRRAYLISIITVISFLLCLTGVSAASAPSLKLHYKIDSAPVAGVSVTVYKVADCSAEGKFSLTGGFENYPVDVGVPRTTENWDILAETLYSYAAADKISPAYTGLSDENGVAEFDSVGYGMYLIVSADVMSEGKIIRFAPALAAVAGDELSVYLKGEITEPSSDTLTYKVIKLWQDDGADLRPESIEIAVMRDGETVERKALSADNNWTYTWTAANDGSVWSVAEMNVPDEYTVTVESRNTTFVITNTRPSEDNPPSSTDPPPHTPPQTGDPMAKYVILAAGSGLCLILLGLTMRRRKES